MCSRKRKSRSWRSTQGFFAPRAELLESRTLLSSPPAPATLALSPVADAYVRDGQESDQNFGTAPQLLVKHAVPGDGYIRLSYLKFDLVGVPAISSATLELSGAEQPGGIDSSVNVEIGSAANSNWSETTIDFANAPVVGTRPLAKATVTSTSRRLYSFDLTNYLQRQQTQGASFVTLAIAGTSSTTTIVSFAASEAGTNSPQLLLTTTPTPTPAPTPTPMFPSGITWRSAAPSPIPRAEAVGTAVNGKLYIFGGFGNTGSVHTTIPLTPRCDVYDPETNTWARLKNFPEPFSHSQAVIVGNDLWFVGGYVGDHPGPGTNHVWVYHTTSDTWTRGPNLPIARGAGAAALVGHNIYCAGGMDAARLTDEGTSWTLDLSNPAAGWKRLADMPDPRNHIAAVTLDGAFYALGGQHGQETEEVPQSEMDRYDPSTNTWTKVASLPVALAHITAGTFAYDGRIIVIGGEGRYGAFQSRIYSYDPSADRWSFLGNLPLPRGAVVSGIVDGQIVTSTGNGATSPATSNTWIGTFT